MITTNILIIVFYIIITTRLSQVSRVWPQKQKVNLVSGGVYLVVLSYVDYKNNVIFFAFYLLKDTAKKG